MATKTIQVVEIDGTFGEPKAGRELACHIVKDSEAETIVAFLKRGLQVGQGLLVDGVLRSAKRFDNDVVEFERASDSSDVSNTLGDLREVITAMAEQTKAMAAERRSIAEANGKQFAALMKLQTQSVATIVETSRATMSVLKSIGPQARVQTDACPEYAEASRNLNETLHSKTMDLAPYFKAALMTAREVAMMVASAKQAHEPAQILYDWSTGRAGKK